MKKETITLVLVIVLKSFEKFFNNQSTLSKIQKVPYQRSKKSTLSRYLNKGSKKCLIKVPYQGSKKYLIKVP